MFARGRTGVHFPSPETALACSVPQPPADTPRASRSRLLPFVRWLCPPPLQLLRVDWDDVRGPPQRGIVFFFGWCCHGLLPPSLMRAVCAVLRAADERTMAVVMTLSGMYVFCCPACAAGDVAERVKGQSYCVDCCLPICIASFSYVPTHCCFWGVTRYAISRHGVCSVVSAVHVCVRVWLRVLPQLSPSRAVPNQGGWCPVAACCTLPPFRLCAHLGLHALNLCRLTIGVPTAVCMSVCVCVCMCLSLSSPHFVMYSRVPRYAPT
jgi:hypothetical protein